ncbi:MAG: insulinase family protein [Candidatus Latescibacteria bacterium]|nr:insulinase family protein [Candidatus Latescibacterota bacterium]
MLTAPAHSADIVLPSPQRTVLPNGLTVLILPQEKLPLVVFRMVIRAGAAADPDGKAGLANLTASLLKQGAGGRTAAQMAEEVEFLGGSLEAESTYDATFITGQFLSRDMEKGLSLLADILIRPSFTDEEVERERDQMLATLAQSREDAEYLADIFYNRFLFGRHPYGRPDLGTDTSVAGLTRLDVVEFHRRYYAPNNAFVVVVGDVKPAETIRLVTLLFGTWSRRAVVSRPLPHTTGLQGRRVWLVDKPDMTQSQVCIGNLGIPRNHPDFFPVVVANTVFGEGFTSRLMNEVRVNRGLTYSIGSVFPARKERGAFLIYTSTRNETTGDLIDAVLAELKRFREDGVSETELAAAQQYLRGQFPLSLEGPEALVEQIALIELYQLPADSIRTYSQRIQAVNRADVLRVARQYFAYESLGIVVLGNTAQVKPQVERFGPVEAHVFDEEW